MIQSDRRAGLWTRRGIIGAAAGVTALAGMPGAATDTLLDGRELRPGEFTWHPERSPKGSVAVIVSLPEQLVHVYRNGVRIAVSTCSTGKQGHATPTGVFTVLQKDRDHRSSSYSDAPMPNMNRLTWDGIALHAGNLPGYPASHGCVRLPLDFSEKLFTVTHVGTPVIIAGASTDPWELVHPGVILGNPAEGEMKRAVAALDARHHPSDWIDGAGYPVVTVLATGADRRVALIEDGAEVLEGDLTIQGAPTLGEHVLLLSGSDSGGQLVWTGLTHHPDPAQPLRAEAFVLDRLRVPRDFRQAMADRLHPGMTFIVSDLAAHPDRRSGRDLVILASDDVSSPLPQPKPHGTG